MILEFEIKDAMRDIQRGGLATMADPAIAMIPTDVATAFCLATIALALFDIRDELHNAGLGLR